MWQIAAQTTSEVAPAFRPGKWYNGSKTNPDRQLVRKSTLAELGRDDDWRHTTVEERWNMMWQLAVDAWAMKGEDVAEQRFQRHVERLKRLESRQ